MENRFASTAPSRPRPQRAPYSAAAPVAAPRHLSAAGLEFTKEWETFRARLHNDASGNCCIGYGTMLHAGCCDGRPAESKYNDGITEAEASELLSRRMAQFEELIRDDVKLVLGRNEYDALVSFVAGIGGAAFERSTLLRLLNAGNVAAVPVEMRKWTRVRDHGSVVERPSLVERRSAEADLFAKPDPQLAGARSLTLSLIDFTIPGPFEVMAQPSSNTCWAAVFAMMYCWRNAKSMTIRDALATLGDVYVGMFDRDQALDGRTATSLYEQAGLLALQSFQPSVDGWVTLLRKYGPLYVDAGSGAGAGTHAIIVTGIAGDGSLESTSIIYADPDGGRTVTLGFRDFLARFEASSAVQWPYTIVHWPPATSGAASMPVTHSFCYTSPGTAAKQVLSRAQNPVAVVIAGMEVADAAQIGLAAAAMVQSQAASTQGGFSLAFDKAERLLTNEARQQMPGARSAKSRYKRLFLHLPQLRAGTAYADVIVEWEGNSYGEIGTVMFRRDLANSTEFSKSEANISLTWVHQIPTEGVDPRAWPIVYSYEGTYDPLGNGYFEFHGEVEINAFGGIHVKDHKVFSRSLVKWVPGMEPENNVQAGPDVLVATPTIPQEQVAYLKSHLP